MTKSVFAEAREAVMRKVDKTIRRTNRRLKAQLHYLAPRQFKKHRILAGPLRGKWIVTSWHHYHTSIIGRTEPDLIAWFETQVGAAETWLDIGANYGYTALALRRLVGPKGRVFAFEPKLSTCGCLSQTTLVNELAEITVVPLGLGAPDSIELRRLPAVGGMVASTPDAGGPLETIVVARLDWLWPRISVGSQDVHGVKIDVQGMELEVLEGMRDLLKTYHPKLVVEVHEGVNRCALLRLLSGCGYLQDGIPLTPIAGEEGPKYCDDRSYAFFGA